MAKKNKIVISNASLKEDFLTISFAGKSEKKFELKNIKKISIRKIKIDKRFYLLPPLILILSYFLNKYLAYLLIPIICYIIYRIFFSKEYRLILIEHSGKKYNFIFYKNIRSIIFDIRLKIKYMLLTA